jgi:hypothetical protein
MIKLYEDTQFAVLLAALFLSSGARARLAVGSVLS